MQQLYKFSNFEWATLHSDAQLMDVLEVHTLDGSEDPTLENLARIAALSCQCPSAAVAFAHDNALTIAASYGCTEEHFKQITDSVFQQVANSGAPFVAGLLEASSGSSSLGAFASVPIKSSSCRLLGILCVVNTSYSNISTLTQAQLTAIATQIEQELIWRRKLSVCEEDVTKLRKSEARLESALSGMSLVNDIGRAARSADDPNSILELAVDRLGKALKADRCYFVTYNASEQIGTISPEWHRPGVRPIAGTYNMFEFNFNRDPGFHGGRTSVVEDILTLPSNAGVKLSLDLGLRALLRAPIQRGSQMTALGVAMAVPRKWTDDEIQLVEMVAAQTRAAVETASQVLRERTLLRDVLVNVTEGKLRLAESEEKLPDPLSPVGPPVHLDHGGGLSKLRELSRLASSMANHSDIRSYDLMLAVGEAGMNAIVHANTGQALVSVSEQGCVQVRVVDRGKGIKIENIPNATLARGYSTKSTLGHGLKMMLETVDRIYLLTGPSGTTVVLEQERQQPDTGWNLPV